MVATCLKKIWMRGTNDWKNKWTIFKKKHVFATNYVSWQQVSDMIGYEKKNIVRSFSEIRNVHQSAKNKYNFTIMFLSVKTECEDFEQLIFYSTQNWEKKLSAWRNRKIQFHKRQGIKWDKAFLVWIETMWSNKLKCQIIFGKYWLCVLWSKDARNHLMVWGCISAY